MTQLDSRPRSARGAAPGPDKHRPGARRSTLLSLEQIVEMVGASDRPAWVSVGGQRSPVDGGPANVYVSWHLDQEQDGVRMTLAEARAFAAALLATCEELGLLDGRRRDPAPGTELGPTTLRSV